MTFLLEGIMVGIELRTDYSADELRVWHANRMTPGRRGD